MLATSNDIIYRAGSERPMMTARHYDLGDRGGSRYFGALNNFVAGCYHDEEIRLKDKLCRRAFSYQYWLGGDNTHKHLL